VSPERPALAAATDPAWLTWPERTRVLCATGLGVVAALATTWFVPWQLTLLVWWDVTALVLIAWSWAVMAPADAATTGARAVREDSSRTVSTLLALTAAVASLVGVALAVVKANTVQAPLSGALNATAVFTVAVSWCLVHTMFSAHYARLYYVDEPGGIDFKTREPPNFRDFAYVAFTVGMTFQVSDTDIQSPVIRRTVLIHALLSYLFGVVIIAAVINIVAGLVR
jgi:uncharacterized membrane protein